MSRVHTTWLAAVLLLLWAGTPAIAQPPELQARVSEAFRAAYSLDTDDALRMAREAVAIAPTESSAHRSLAAIIWVNIIFGRGAVTVDHYMGGITKSSIDMPKPPAALDAEFRAELARAIDLATTRLKATPSDLKVMFDLGAAYGLQASYVASVEGSVSSAFLSARRAFNAQETVLTRDPTRLSAGVVVGTYRYVVAGLALPSRMFAYMMGFGGDKEKAIAILDAATRDATASVDARLALVLIYSREGRHADALRLLDSLVSDFPRNRLFVLEQGSAAIRAGQMERAEDVLTRGLAAFEHDDRRKIPGERALWLYKRGLARLGRDHRPDAVADLRSALQNNPESWIGGRIHLALGKLADLDGHREAAVAEYQQARAIGLKANDPSCTTEANRWLKQPFSFLQKS